MKSSKLALREIVLIGLLSVVFGLLYIGAVYAGGALTAVLTPSGLGLFGYEPFYGIWFMAAILATYILRRPGVGILCEVIASLIEVFLGSTFGPLVIISAIVQGLGVELPFFVTRYRRYDYKVTLAAGFFAALFSFLWTAVRGRYFSIGFPVVAAIFFIRVISSLFFTGILSKKMCDSMKDAGVLDAYAISYDERR